jgi:hypothetical protein
VWLALRKGEVRTLVPGEAVEDANMVAPPAK